MFRNLFPAIFRLSLRPDRFTLTNGLCVDLGYFHQLPRKAADFLCLLAVITGTNSGAVR